MQFVCEIEADLDCEVFPSKRVPMQKRPRSYSPRFDRRRTKNTRAHNGMHHRRDKRNYL